jgi:hypothetical protein
VANVTVAHDAGVSVSRLRCSRSKRGRRALDGKAPKKVIVALQRINVVA